MNKNRFSGNSSFIGNIINVLTTNFWGVLIGFIGTFIFPKILSIDAYAVYHTFLLYIGYIAILHLGFPSGMVINYVGKDYQNINREQYKSEIIILLSILLFFTIAFSGIAMFTKSSMFFYIAISIIPVGIIGSYKALLQAWSRFRYYSRLNTSLTIVVPAVVLISYLIIKEISGETYIWVYILTNWIATSIILAEIYKKVKNIKHNAIFSKRNWNTEKTGILLVLGNYINTLFGTVDKQFVSWFFTNKEFAFYSFAMSLQSIMTIFITSISQPLFPAMAQGKLKDEEYNDIKSILLVFGSLSGCAYFAVSIIVKLFIKKYIKSLEIVEIYFSVFPAMTVISCLFINLYKIKGKFKSYIWTLGGVLGIAVILNWLFIKITGGFVGVAIATVVVYYIWLFIGIKQFEFIKISIRDLIFIVGFFICFFLITRVLNDYIGIVIYFVTICLLMFACYGKSLLLFAKKIWKMG